MTHVCAKCGANTLRAEPTEMHRNKSNARLFTVVCNGCGDTKGTHVLRKMEAP